MKDPEVLKFVQKLDIRKLISPESIPGRYHQFLKLLHILPEWGCGVSPGDNRKLATFIKYSGNPGIFQELYRTTAAHPVRTFNSSWITDISFKYI